MFTVITNCLDGETGGKIVMERNDLQINAL